MRMGTFMPSKHELRTSTVLLHCLFTAVQRLYNDNNGLFTILLVAPVEAWRIASVI